MKRDEVLVWEILLDTEGCESIQYEIFIESYRDKGAEVIKHHLELMEESGLVKCTQASLFDLIYDGKQGVSFFIELTSKGHDTLAEGRRSIFNKAVKHVLPMGKNVINSLISAVITNALSTPPI
ncbi:DUF2513 domain-containing protein [Aeromonas salmonicida]|uniref:DUF2513 domain-containing protein n=1 Tax=Aeromonas salmonicida TaxID=645 RepID=UPI0038BDAB66